MAESDEKRKSNHLRKQAEDALSETPPNPGKSELKDLKSLTHELQVHEIELKMQNEELLNANETVQHMLVKYKDLYDHAPVGYVTLEHDGSTVEANLTFGEMLSMPEGQFMNRRFGLFVEPAYVAIFNDFLKKTIDISGSRQSCLLAMKIGDGNLVYIQMEGIGRYSQEKNKTLCKAAILDINARRKAEEELQRSMEELEQRAHQLEKANQEMESFSYAIAHDLRTPLRSIDGFGSILRAEYADKIDDIGKGYIDRMHKATLKMAQLIDDLLNLAFVTRSNLEYSMVDIGAIARSILGDLSEKHPERNVEMDIQDGLTVNADARLLEIALRNLLDNAWKFTDKASHAKIEVGSIIKRDRTVYYVKDNGIGFEMKYATMIFGVFHRLHHMDDYEGTGMGLTTVQRIINRHGGSIWVESGVDSGAAFFFTLGS